MTYCDNCGKMTTNHGDKALIILCDDCMTGNEPTIDDVIKELEAEGIDVKAFLKRIHSTITRCKGW